MFDNSYPDSVDLTEDAPKMTNFEESLSLLRNSHVLSLEKKKPLTAEDTIFYSITNTAQKAYTLEFIAANLDQTGLTGIIKDSYTATSTPLNMNGSTVLNFTINSNAASQNAKRFMIVFRPSSVLALEFTNLKATQQQNGIMLTWSVANENGITQYEVQKSTDGTDFTTIGTVSADGAASYNWLDQNPVDGENYYRIVAVQANGSLSYSNIVNVETAKGAPAITAYPNPVTGGTVSLQLTNMPAGTYDVRLVDNIGQVVMVKSIIHPGGSSAQTLQLGNYLAKGNYNLQVIKPDNTTNNINLLIQ